MVYKHKLLEWLLILIATIIISYSLSSGSVRAEDNISFWRSLDSEITILSKQFKVSEKLVRAIIRCEGMGDSKAINPNIDDKGNVWSIDFGSMQINNYFHANSMKKLGLDYFNEYDSLKYGIMLLSTEGTQHWKSSSYCWSKLI